MAFAQDGAIIGAGDSFAAGRRDAAVVRVRNPQGDLDTSTADGFGVLYPDLGDATSNGNAVAVLPDGRILLAGRRTAGGNGDVLVARLTAGVVEDLSFGGGDGFVTLDAGGNDTAEAIAVAPDGRIVVAGRRDIGDASDTLGARFLPDGTPAPSFGTGGGGTVDLAAYDAAEAVVVQPDGRIVVGTQVFPSPTTGDMAVLRLRTDGTLDPAFGSGGRVTVDFGASDYLWDMVLRPDGRIVMAGERDAAAGGTDIAVAQLLADPPAAAPQPGGAAVATALCGGRRATVVGTARADRLRGTARADVIAGLGGNDRITGLGGNDIVCGGAGNDQVDGGAGADRLIGGAGADRIAGGAGADRVEGGAGADRLLGGAGRDRLLGGAGADRLVGGAGVDALLGGAGRNVRTQ